MVHIVFRFKGDHYPKNVRDNREVNWFQFDAKGDGWFRVNSSDPMIDGHGLCIVELKRTGDWKVINNQWAAKATMLYRSSWGEGPVAKENMWVTVDLNQSRLDGDAVIEEANRLAAAGRYVA